jgi:hypothetical protein
MTVPTMPATAQPDMTVIRSAHDVVLVDRSIFVHACVPVDMPVAFDMGVACPTVVSMASAVMPTAMVTSAVMVSSSMAAAMPLGVRCSHASKPECRRDRKNKSDLLQHFLCLLRVASGTSSQESREHSLNRKSAYSHRNPGALCRVINIAAVSVGPGSSRIWNKTTGPAFVTKGPHVRRRL